MLSTEINISFVSTSHDTCTLQPTQDTLHGSYTFVSQSRAEFLIHIRDQHLASQAYYYDLRYERNRITFPVSWAILLPHKRHFYFCKTNLIFSFRLRNKTILGLCVDYVLTETLSRQALAHGRLTFLWKSVKHIILRWFAGRKRKNNNKWYIQLPQLLCNFYSGCIM